MPKPSAFRNIVVEKPDQNAGAGGQRNSHLSMLMKSTELSTTPASMHMFTSMMGCWGGQATDLSNRRAPFTFQRPLPPCDHQAEGHQNVGGDNHEEENPIVE